VPGGRAPSQSHNEEGFGTIQIRDVAERAGVSPATVSRVLNGASTVQEAYRRRVLAAIEELGYRPNRLAQNLRRQQAEMIGLVVSDIENPHFTEMVRAVEDAAYRLGYRVLLCNTDETEEKQRSYLHVLAAERVLGVILSPSNPAGEEIGELLDLGIPLVAFDRHVRDRRADAVMVDNASAGRMAAQHLLAAGHRRIGFVSSAEIETGAERLRGYEEVMRAAGEEPCAAPGWSRIAGGAAAVEQLLHEERPLTAMIVGNNLMAIGALQALRAHGLRVPEHMALVAIDDPFWASIVEPPLTTLAQPIRRMAESVVALLVERLRKSRSAPRQLTYDFELRVRDSCGARR
jgi:DNA-binding LacI/PurR family transcriptional regulator